jgi:phage tail-like protein
MRRITLATALALVLAAMAAPAAELVTKAMGAGEQRPGAYKTYRLLVLMDGRVVAGVSKVSGLETREWTCLKLRADSKRALYQKVHACIEKLDTFTMTAAQADMLMRDADSGSDASRKTSVRAKWDAITLERGVTHDAGFVQWASAGASAPRKEIEIVVYDELGNPVLPYKLHRCWISQYRMLPALDAGANVVAIEHIKLENEGWEMDPLGLELKR